MSATPRSTASASISRAYLWDSLDFGLNLQLLDPKTKADEPDARPDAGRAPAVLGEGERRGVARVHVTRRNSRAATSTRRYQWTYIGNSLNGIGRTTPSRCSPPTRSPTSKIGLDADDWEIYAYVDNIFNERAILFDQQSAAARHVTINCAAHLGHRLLEELGRQLTTSRRAAPKSERVRVQRMRKRGHYDRETIDAILDEGILCHVGFVHARAPVVIPTLYWREGDSRLPARLGRQPHARHGPQVAGLRDGDPSRRPRPHALGLPPLHQLPLRRHPRRAGGSRRTRARRKNALRTFMEGLMPGPLGRAAPGQAEGTEGDAAAAPRHRRGLGEDPLRPAGGR